MSTRTVTVPPIPWDHLSQLWNGVSGLMVTPYINAIKYFLPFLGAFLSGYQQLSTDPSKEAMMPERLTRQLLGEIEDLTRCAQLENVTPYIALNPGFSSCGGRFSLTSPVLCIPDQHLFRRDGRSPFGQEVSNEYQANIWIFSDDETRFLIARELAQIKENNAFHRVAIKVAVLVALFFIYTSPLGWPLGMALFIGVLGLYIVSERFFQARADIVAAEILGRKLGDTRRAAQIGIDVIQKLQRQNRFLANHSPIARCYTTEAGTNLLDFEHPSPSAREAQLREVYEIV